MVKNRQKDAKVEDKDFLHLYLCKVIVSLIS